MTVYTRFDKENLDVILSEIVSEIKKIGDKYGVDITRGNCTFGSGDFRLPITAKIRVREEGVMTKEERDYDANARIYGLPERGYSYNSNGVQMTVVGWKSRARKYPVILRGSDGKSYKTSMESIKLHNSQF